MVDFWKPLLAGLWLVLAMLAPAFAQTSEGPGGSIFPNVVPWGGCTLVGSIWQCAGPQGSPSAPVTVTPKPDAATGAYSAVTVGTSDSTIVTASTAVYMLDIVNTSASATICINFGSAATITGTQCAAGEYTLPPLWHRSWENNFIPTDAIHAIASAASTQASVGVK